MSKRRATSPLHRSMEDVHSATPPKRSLSANRISRLSIDGDSGVSRSLPSPSCSHIASPKVVGDGSSSGIEDDHNVEHDSFAGEDSSGEEFDNSDLYDFDESVSSLSVEERDLDIDDKIDTLKAPEEEYNSNHVFADLPDEIIHQIGYYLHPMDRFNYAVCCSRVWNATSPWCDVISAHIYMKPLPPKEQQMPSGEKMAKRDNIKYTYYDSDDSEADDLTLIDDIDIEDQAGPSTSCLPTAQSVPNPYVAILDGIPTEESAQLPQRPLALEDSVLQDIAIDGLQATAEQTQATGGAGQSTTHHPQQNTGVLESIASGSESTAHVGQPAPHSHSLMSRLFRRYVAPGDEVPLATTAPSVNEQSNASHINTPVTHSIRPVGIAVATPNDACTNVHVQERAERAEAIAPGERAEEPGLDVVVAPRPRDLPGVVLERRRIMMQDAMDDFDDEEGDDVLMHMLEEGRAINLHDPAIIGAPIGFAEGRRQDPLLRRMRYHVLAVGGRHALRDSEGYHVERDAQADRMATMYVNNKTSDILITGRLKNPFHPNRASKPFQTYIRGSKLRNWMYWFGGRVDKMEFSMHCCLYKMPYKHYVRSARMLLHAIEGMCSEKDALCQNVRDLGVYSCCLARVPPHLLACLRRLYSARINANKPFQTLRLGYETECRESRVRSGSIVGAGEEDMWGGMMDPLDRANADLRELEQVISRGDATFAEYAQTRMVRGRMVPDEILLLDAGNFSTLRAQMFARYRTRRDRVRSLIHRRLAIRGLPPPNRGSGGPPDRPTRSDVKDQFMRALQRLVNTAAKAPLKILDVDKLLVETNRPMMSLDYPSDIEHLISGRTFVSSSFIPSLTNMCPNLTSVHLRCNSNRVENTNYEALVNLAHLKCVKLSASPSSISVEITERILTGILNNVSSTPAFPKVETFVAQNIGLSDKILGQMHNCFGNAHTLELSCHTPSNDEGLTQNALQHFFAHSPQLQSFVLGRASADFNDNILDTIADKCPLLRVLYVHGTSCTVELLPRLMRSCRELRLVHLGNLCIKMKNLDGVVMFMGLSQDILSDWIRHDITPTPRLQIVTVEVDYICDGSYDSVNRIMEGLSPSLDVRFSMLSDVCVHDLTWCDWCCFYKNTKDPDGDPEEQEHIKHPVGVSLVMARSDTKYTGAVFTTCKLDFSSVANAWQKAIK